MKTLHKLAVAALLAVGATNYANAQVGDAAALIKQGIELHDKGKYNDAIDRYQQALKVEPGNQQAEFEMSYSLYAAGKGNEAIKHLDKIINDPKDPVLAAQACDILGSIYDDSQQPDKAIATYQKGISIQPKYQRLRYNLALALFRQKKYDESEASAIEAIKLDPRHASSQDIYAAAALNQNKAFCALLAYCNFLMLEPQTKRSAGAYAQVLQIFKAAGDQKDIMLTLDGNKQISGIAMANMSINLAASAAKAIKEKTSGSDVSMLAYELNMVFKTAGKEAAKQQPKDFFWSFYADYFGKMADTGNVDAFARLISMSVNQEESAKWFKDNPDKVKAFTAWVDANQHEF